MVLLLENADIGVTQVVYGTLSGGRIHRVVMRRWSLSNRGRIHVAASRCTAELIAQVRTGGARGAAYGMAGR